MSADRYPWYPWYIAEYRASRRVKALSIIQRGIYRELLDECWLRGFIPDDVVELASICAISVSLMERHWPAVSKLFIQVRGMDGGFLTSERMEVERAKRDALREKKVAAGKASAESRNTRSTPVQQRSTSTAHHITTHPLGTQAAELPTDISPRPVRSAAEWKRLGDTGSLT